MLAALLALPAVAFTFVENPAPQGGHMFAATNAFVIEVEEISYPKNPRNNLHLGVGSLQTPTQKKDPSEYPKSPRRNLQFSRKV